MNALEITDIARWQFGIITVYHFLFVPLTIGLSAIVALMQTIWLKTKNDDWLRLTKFIGKLFLINIAMGVVTGIVQEFQFGMNWSTYSRFVGDIFGAPLAVEALLAFFLESTFIGLWIFGWDRVPRKIHVTFIWLVHIGTLASSWFILAANSWMQHPVGYRFNEERGRAELTDFWAVMFNKVQLGTFPHVIAASYMTAAVFLVAVCGFLYGKRATEAASLREAESVTVNGRDRDMYARGIRLGAVIAVVGFLGVAISGDVQGKIMTDVQPMKMAAAEALWDTSDSCAPFSIFTIGTPDGSAKRWSLEVPCVLSFLATGDPQAKVQGINDLQAQYEQQFGPGNYKPIIPVTYWSFRWMMGLGVAGVAGAVLLAWMTRKRRTPTWPWYNWIVVLAPLWALLGNGVGWVFTEMGRQPWVVFGLMQTADAASPNVSTTEAWISITALALLYAVLAVIEVGLLLRFIRKGADAYVEPPDLTWKDIKSDDDQPLTFAY
ncbi:cytochrome ubiquinol oxidase subunit I [Nocardioides nematodiphilus]|uniref:cytochrome ubiquinol oxidase subunit I n=1 Tax=Nocardioides nematodiphilus TaxID=2849669 RepID=UPI001CD9E8C4|nr:cytochrome ubiquinol oxidase subunit I [Nocardioides nematodiphilus]MCA1983012.1 cytochrome ubiquinol oxidase subunit I [Nocardioides nematodiphilus]